MDPLVLEFDVAAPIDHAFDVWVARTSLWWPRTHTISGADDLAVVFEPFAGGRIYERSSDGTEHDWGEIVVWQPPQRIAYWWHLFFDRSEATEVEVSFAPAGSGTKVRIEQTGWERLGDQAGPRRDNTHRAWSSIIGRFQEAVEDIRPTSPPNS